MINFYIDDKIIVVEGFKNPQLRMAVDFDDVKHYEVKSSVEQMVKVLNEAGL